MSERLAGGCQCGAVRYTITGAPIAYCCHCTECRKQSASAFGMSVPVFEAAFSVTGELERWSRPTDSGSITDCYFCQTCGSRVYHSGRSRPGMITVKHGSLDRPDIVPVVAHIWLANKVGWFEPAADVAQWQEQPRTDAEWGRLMQGKSA